MRWLLYEQADIVPMIGGLRFRLLAGRLTPDDPDAVRRREGAHEVLQLPDDLRFTVTAHFWGGLAVKEIAKIEEITTVAIRKRLHKAFSILETMLHEEVR